MSTTEPCSCEESLELRAEVAKLEGRVASADSELRSAMDRIIQLTDERDALRELAGEFAKYSDIPASATIWARAKALGIGGMS